MYMFDQQSSLEIAWQEVVGIYTSTIVTVIVQLDKEHRFKASAQRHMHNYIRGDIMSSEKGQIRQMDCTETNGYILYALVRMYVRTQETFKVNSGSNKYSSIRTTRLSIWVYKYKLYVYILIRRDVGYKYGLVRLEVLPSPIFLVFQMRLHVFCA